MSNQMPDSERGFADYKLVRVMIKCECGFLGWVEHTDPNTEPVCPNCVSVAPEGKFAKLPEWP